MGSSSASQWLTTETAFDSSHSLDQIRSPGGWRWCYLLAANPVGYLEDLSWLKRSGEPVRREQEGWGNVRSVRLSSADGTVLESAMAEHRTHLAIDICLLFAAQCPLPSVHSDVHPNLHSECRVKFDLRMDITNGRHVRGEDFLLDIEGDEDLIEMLVSAN